MSINLNNFEFDRGLLQPFNGLDISKTDVSNPVLKKNPEQQYFESPDVFGDFQLNNNRNNEKFIQEVASLSDETKNLDATLFSTSPIDADLEARILLDDLENPADNMTGQDASDNMRNAHDAPVNANAFNNKIASINTKDVQGLLNMRSSRKNSTNVLDALLKVEKGTHKLKIPKQMSKGAQDLLSDILANPGGDLSKKAVDIVRFLPEYSKKIFEYLTLVQSTKKVYDTGLAEFRKLDEGKRYVHDEL